ncbi:MAG: serine/threonine protein phosphatase [Rikenellaceae bacterium]|nr:serine/threonine protein phosphatase [Rikenellaceae bacterium]
MRRFLISIFALCIASFAAAEGVKAPKIVVGPYIQACGQNEFTVVWQTDCDAVSWVEVAPDDGTHFYNTAREQFFHTIHGRRAVGRWHTVKVTGLNAGTTYRYRVLNKAVVFNPKSGRPYYSEGKGSDVYRRQPYRMRTLCDKAQTVRFAVGNDFHDKPELLEQLFSKEVITPKNYDFVLYNGDMVSKFETEPRLVLGVLNPSVAQFATQVPLFYARGNHETRGAHATAFSDYFPTSTGLPYYTFSVGSTFFIVLDGGEDKPDSDIEYYDLVRYDNYREQEAKWLQSVVESPECKNAQTRIVVIHIPPKSSGWHGEAEIARLFVPILNRADIDLMLSGHIHKYRFSEAGDTTYGCNFPIVCNPNRTRMDVEISSNKIAYKITNTEGEEITNEISIK